MSSHDDHPPLSDVELGAYFALIEVSSLLRHTIEQQLREAGDLSYVQFQLLATLGDAPDGTQRMTELADGVVYSRSGLTYQVGLLEKAGLVTRNPAADDERGVDVMITDTGRDVLSAVFPGHIAALRQLFLEPVDTAALAQLGSTLTTIRDHMRTIPPRSAKPRSRRRETP